MLQEPGRESWLFRAWGELKIGHIFFVLLPSGSAMAMYGLKGGHSDDIIRGPCPPGKMPQYFHPL